MNAGSYPAAQIISLQTSYRLDNRKYAGDAKDSDKQEVALHRRQTTPSAASAESTASIVFSAPRAGCPSRRRGA